MRQTIKEYRIPIIIISVVLLVALLSTSLWIVLGRNSGNKQITRSNEATKISIKTVVSQATQGSSVDSVSPLLFGTNLALFDSQDQVINSTKTQGLLQQIHTQIVRMPVRKTLSNDIEIQAAQGIKRIGAIPLVVLHGAATPTVLTDDSLIINDMNAVFGKSIVYYEFGNEEDLAHIDATTYTNEWNRTVPQLRQLALNGRFIGPVNYQYDHSYLATFLQNAQPRPAAISWHEYTCSKNRQADECIANIDKWTMHIADARNVIQSTIGTMLPIMITEWNYAADLSSEGGQVPADGKHENPAFMAAWTTKALQTLAANRVFASMQYSCTNTAISLVDDNNTITAQGTVFKNTYQQMIIQKQQPAAVSTMVTGQQNGTSVTTSRNSTSTFSFEDGTTDGWNGQGKSIANVQNSTMNAQDGKHSLQVTLNASNANDFSYVAVGTANAAAYPHPGQTITAYIYVASTSIQLQAKLFITEHDNTWHTSDFVSLTPNTWNRLTYTTPDNFTEQPQQFGVQFNNTMNNGGTNVYIDGVSWS